MLFHDETTESLLPSTSRPARKRPDRSDIFPQCARAAVYRRRRDSFHCVRVPPDDNAAVSSVAFAISRDQRRRGNTGRAWNTLGADPPMGWLGIDRTAHRGVSRKCSGVKHRHDHVRSSGANVDVVAPSAASIGIARMGLSRLCEAKLVRVRWIEQSLARC
jgi:hypothetical protein